MSDKHNKIVLALYPSTRGYAFVLFDRKRQPIDWGVREIQSTAKTRNARSLADVEALLDNFHPTDVVVEDYTESGSRRSVRIRQLYDFIAHTIQSRSIDLHRLSKKTTENAFARDGAVTKYEIAQAVARRIHEFTHRLPTQRKIWESEKPVMGLFAAAALGLAYFSSDRSNTTL